jgi:large subunit ribosomal protein L16
MLQPARRKYRKEFRGSMGGVATRGSRISYGDFGIKAMESGWVSANEIESARRTITHHTKRQGRFFMRVFPHKPIGWKTPGARMGSGKSDVSAYVSVVKPGQILMEVSGVTRATAQEAFRKAGHKFSVKTKFVAKDND